MIQRKYLHDISWHIFLKLKNIFFFKEKNFEFWAKFFCTSHILVILELFPSEPPRILHYIIIICLHWLRLYNIYMYVWILYIYIYIIFMCIFSHFSCVRLFATLWTVICQAPLSMRFSRQEYWSGLPCPSPGDLPDPEIEPASLMSPALAAGSLPLAPPGRPQSSKETNFYIERDNFLTRLFWIFLWLNKLELT